MTAVIAMRQAIPDAAGIVFAQEFYGSIAQGYPIDLAVAEARRGIFLASDGAHAA
jgi:hypothetical protein